jgi:16S rRNA (guanine527-N7)-methyltransferase
MNDFSKDSDTSHDVIPAQAGIYNENNQKDPGLHRDDSENFINNKLAIYKELLLKWQNAVNLVSPNTLGDIDTRHFQDSLQIVDYIPHHVTKICDIGSGAGFPGLVIAMARPEIEVTLIESDSKKCSFLKTVSRETQTPINVLNGRIEQVIGDQNPQIITSRALASIKDIIQLCEPALAKDNPPVLLLSKGQSVKDEIADALSFKQFSYELFPSKTDRNGAIVWIKF